jgi:hypothetical protein
MAGSGTTIPLPVFFSGRRATSYAVFMLESLSWECR